MKNFYGRLRKLEAQALLAARPGEIRDKSRHLLVFVGCEGPPSEPTCWRTLYSTGELFEQVLIDEHHPLLTDEAAMDRFVGNFPIKSVEAGSFGGKPR